MNNKNTVDMDEAMLGEGTDANEDLGEEAQAQAQVDLNELSEEEREEAEARARFDAYPRDETGRVIYPLLEPVTITGGAGEHTWKQLAIRKPKGRDLRASGAGKNEADTGLILLARCINGGTGKLVDELDPMDIKYASEILGFLSQSSASAKS